MSVVFEPAIHGEARIPGRKIEVKLRITTGPSGQTGSTTYTLAGSQAVTRKDSFSDLLGKGNEVDGKLLHCTTLISDIAPDHDEVRYKIEVLAGPDEKVVWFQERKRSVPAAGDQVNYTAYVSMITVLP